MTKRYAVLGDPISHSLSPLMHSGWITDYGLDASYEAMLLRSDDAVHAIRGLKDYAGVNVTVPHKEAAARAADRGGLDVANVLRWEADGSISAFNTDGPGFLDALTEAAPSWRADVGKALILGAGGAAKGIAQALAGAADLIVANRTFSRAAELAAHLPRARAVRWTSLPESFAEADLIVNATTLGMGDDAPTWPVGSCRPSALVVDIVYRPLNTGLLKAARQRGLVAVDGLGMLIHQGARAFEIWHGLRPDVARARSRLMGALAAT